MKNRGLLTRSIVSPLGMHKDPTPAELTNQQLANVPTEVTPNDLARTDQMQPQQDPDMQDADKPSRPKSRPVPKVTARRYTLVLKLDSGLHRRLDVSLARFGPSSRSAAKRAMLLAFRSRLAVTPLNAVLAAAPIDVVSYRIDIRLPDPLVGKLLATAGQSAFEPMATALARSLAPHFADFVREALGPIPAAASANRVAEPTIGVSPVHR
jgi:hypothetical protein